MIGKKLINTGAEAAFLPSRNFDTVTYTGNGGTQRIGGYINRGAAFNGSSSRIINTSFSAITGNAARSYSVWACTNGTTAGTLVSTGQWGTAGLSIGIWFDQSTGQFYVQGFTSSHDVNLGTLPTLSNGWHHFVLTWDGVNEFKAYIDGSLFTTQTKNATYNTTSYISIGEWYDATQGVYHFNNKLDQVRIFNKALSSSEVTTLYGETATSTSKSVTDIFNDDSGVALYQLDGNANDTGGVSGKFGSAAIFNGSSSSIEVSSLNLRNLFDTSGELSISFWHNSTYNDYGRIIEFSKNFNISYFTLATKKIQFNLVQSNGTNVQFQSSTTFSDNVWYNVSVTYDSSNIKVYVNGSLDTTQSYDGTIRNFTDSNYQFHTIGSGKSVSSGIFFNYIGKLDQFRIYSSALSSSDITNLYNESSVPTANLVAHYKFDGDARDEQQLYDGAATNVIYAYDGTATNVTYQKATDFQPDLVWVKARTSPYSHNLQDSVRGGGQSTALNPNLTLAEGTYGIYGFIDTFDTNGFTVKTGSTGAEHTNSNGVNYVAWAWKAGGSAVTGTSSEATNVTMSPNPDAGFSIVKFTSSNSTSAVMNYISHGLNSPVEMTIYKILDGSGDWRVQHKDLNQDGFLFLNSTNALGSPTGQTFYDNTSTVGSIGVRSNYAISRSANHIAYCFHSVENYSKIGSYTGTGATGNYIETGFEPAFIMYKRADATGNWVMHDNERNATSALKARLYPNLDEAEGVVNPQDVNLLSNGFEMITTGGDGNASGGTYIYLAIAADPDITEPVVEDSFDVVTYTGNGSTQTINTDFKPDLVWVKGRSAADNHFLNDSIRGAGYTLYSNLTSAENPPSSDSAISSFDSNGFTLSSSAGVNRNSSTYVAWVWKAGDHDDNLPQINTNGTIDSVVSVNAAAGFSIVKWTGTGSTLTVGHGLSSTPELIINKSISGAYDWHVYSSATGATKGLYLNDSAAAATSTAFWNNTAPTSTVFSVGTGNNNNSGQTQITYCFHSVSGYQKIGNYSGTGVSGQTITTGFQPRFVMIKATNLASSWYMIDAVRPNNKFSTANGSNTEYTASDTHTFTSTGFTLSGESYNNSGYDWIYLAIA